MISVVDIVMIVLGSNLLSAVVSSIITYYLSRKATIKRRIDEAFGEFREFIYNLGGFIEICETMFSPEGKLVMNRINQFYRRYLTNYFKLVFNMNRTTKEEEGAPNKEVNDKSHDQQSIYYTVSNLTLRYILDSAESKLLKGLINFVNDLENDALEAKDKLLESWGLFRSRYLSVISEINPELSKRIIRAMGTIRSQGCSSTLFINSLREIYNELQKIDMDEFSKYYR